VVALLRQKDSTTFDTVLTHGGLPAKVIVGGRSDASKFSPVINSARWRNDEAFLDLEIPVLTRAGDMLAYVSDRHWFHGAKQRVEWYSHDMDAKLFSYTLNDDVLEFGLEYATAPASNTVQLDLSHSGLAFYYQDDPAVDCANLAPLQNIERPGNVTGSFAVYHSKQNNQYQAGKFCHIYRWEVIDRNDARAWCEMEITDNGSGSATWTITLPAVFMASAAYPVIAMGADDTLGYTTAGGSNFLVADGDQEMVGPWQVAGGAGTATDMNIYGQTSGTDCDVCVGIMDDSGTAPNAVIRDTANTLMTLTSPDWTQISLDSDVSVSGSTNYWTALAANNNPGQWRIYYDSSPGSERWFRDTGSYTGTGTLADNTGTDIAGLVFSAYANVTLGGGSHPVNPFGHPFHGAFRGPIA